MKKLIYILTVLLVFSCSPRLVHVPVESIKTEKEYVDKWQRDSIYIHDSIFLMHKGDTVFLEKYKYIYRDKFVRDSIYITDSIKIEIPYPVEVVKEVNRLKNWQILLMILGGVLIGYVGYRVIRKFT